MMAGIIPDVSLIDNSEERAPLVLVLDCSGSMQGQPIKKLHEGLKKLDEAIKADPVMAKRVRICVIAFGGDDDVGVTDWLDAMDFDPPEPEVCGLAPIGRAVRVALEEIEAQKEELRAAGVSYKRPIMMLMSNGVPTDDWISAATECRTAEAEHKVTVMAVAVGNLANKDVLDRFGARGAVRLDGLKFNELFVWLSKSVRAVSTTVKGETVHLPPVDSWACGGR